MYVGIFSFFRMFFSQFSSFVISYAKFSSGKPRTLIMLIVTYYKNSEKYLVAKH